jgi:murein hydrolase activator
MSRRRFEHIVAAWAVSIAALSTGRDVPAQDGSPHAPAKHPTAMPATANKHSEVLSEVDRDNERLQRKLNELSERARTSRSLAIVRGRAYVRLARAGLLPIGGGFGELVDHATRLERLRRAIDRDMNAGDRIAKERIAIASRLKELGERRALLQDERDALARSHSEERERAFEHAFSSEWQPGSDHTAVYGSGVGPLRAEDIAAGFEGLRGRLPFPLTGRAEIRPGRRFSGSGSGLEMGGSPHAVVRAIYPGRVAFADEYSDYGRTVIVDHGSSYYSVSANLGSIDVRAGESVQAGDRLGSLTAPSATLYFELRHGAESVDPAPWFGI